MGRGLSLFAVTVAAKSGVDMAVDVVKAGLSSSKLDGDEKAIMERKSSKLPRVSMDCRRLCCLAAGSGRFEGKDDEAVVLLTKADLCLSFAFVFVVAAYRGVMGDVSESD